MLFFVIGITCFFLSAAAAAVTQTIRERSARGRAENAEKNIRLILKGFANNAEINLRRAVGCDSDWRVESEEVVLNLEPLKKPATGGRYPVIFRYHVRVQVPNEPVPVVALIFESNLMATGATISFEGCDSEIGYRSPKRYPLHAFESTLRGAIAIVHSRMKPTDTPAPVRV
jgi:hypothetical protein